MIVTYKFNYLGTKPSLTIHPTPTLGKVRDAGTKVWQPSGQIF